MSEDWYELISAETPLTQGDLVFDCPLLSWQPENLYIQIGRLEQESLEGAINAISADVIVMTQACDLEQRRVENVILCPHISLAVHREVWATEMRTRSQNPTEKAWKTYCEDICNGFIFNYTMLNRCQLDESTIEVRIVHFHEVYTNTTSILGVSAQAARETSISTSPSLQGTPFTSIRPFLHACRSSCSNRESVANLGKTVIRPDVRNPEFESS